MARDRVRLDGKPLETRERVYLLLYKPTGYLTTYRDPQGRPTVYDLVGGVGTFLSPVGRLDLDTSGLLLMTNDTQLAERVTNPRSHVPKTYLVKASVRLTDDQLQLLMGGLLGDGSLRQMGAHSATFRVGHGQAQADYVHWKHQMLQPLSRAIGPVGNGVGFDTYAVPALLDLHRQAYAEDGTRMAASSLLDRLDARGLAVWYGDDGSFAGHYERWGNGKAVLYNKSLKGENRERVIEFTVAWGFVPAEILAGEGLVTDQSTDANHWARIDPADFWPKRTGPVRFLASLPTDRGVILVLTDDGYTSTLWATNDGRAFSRVGKAGFDASAITTDGRTMVLAGHACTPEGECTFRIATSRDGGPFIDSEASLPVIIPRLGFADGTFVLVGLELGLPRFFSSDDGSTWTELESNLVARECSVRRLVSGPSALILIGDTAGGCEGAWLTRSG